MAYKMIQVGTGGRGESWCRVELQPLILSREIEVIAAVDISVDAVAASVRELSAELA